MGFARDISILKNKKLTLQDLKGLYSECECKDMHKYWGAWAKYTNSPFMIVGQNPTFFDEDKDNIENKFTKHYFQDTANWKCLIKMFEGSGIDISSCNITNLCKCATKDNTVPSLHNIAECVKVYLLNEIKFCKPKIIFLLGKETYKSFDLIVSKTSLKERIKKIESIDLLSAYTYLNNNNIYYVYVPHPSACVRNEEHFKNAKAIIHTYDEAYRLILRDQKFNHLHFHNHFSVNDSLIKVEEQIKFLADHHKSEVVSTNHGSLSDAVQIISGANKAGLKPVVGCEFYLYEDLSKFLSIEDSKEKSYHYKNNKFHVVLIAKNRKGFDNLIRINNHAWSEGFYYRPSTDLDFIFKNKEGLIALSACTQGIVSSHLLKNEESRAYDFANRFKNEFGDDYYIEIPLIDFYPQRSIADKLVDISQKLNIKTVVTNDVHYLYKEDYKFRDFKFKMFREKESTESTKEAPKKDHSCIDLYFKSYFDMKTCWKQLYKSNTFTENIFEQSIDNCFSILDSIEKIDVPKKESFCYTKEKEDYFDNTLEIELSKLIVNLDEDKKKQYRDRLETEKKVIKDKKLIEYFLILHDIIGYVKKKYGHKSVGAGRGSASGSLVNYLLGITAVDPVKFDLLFERFLAPERDDIADIDVDFMPSIREDIFRYIREKFGDNRCMKIGTMAFIKLKNAIQDVSRALGIDIQEAFRLTKELYDIDESSSLDDLKDQNACLKDFFDKYPEAEKYVDKMRGTIRQYSSHAAGIVISDVDVFDCIPLVRTSSGIVTGWQEGADFRELTSLGYYKYDILGLNNIEIVDNTLKLIGNMNVLDGIDFNDKKVYDMMSEDDYMGIFQFESVLAKNAIKKIKPDKFEDYVAISALIRPGPLKAGMVDVYANRKNNIEQYEIHDKLKSMLGNTYGVVIYQEQIMKICNVVAGFNMNDANKFRKALVKYSRSLENETKRIEQASGYKKQFVDGAKNTLGQKYAEEMFDIIMSFAGYGFNYSHAFTYGIISFEEAFLKTYYPLQFYCALMCNTAANLEDDFFDFKLHKYILSAMTHGIEILPPDINLSSSNFSIEGDKIRYGLSLVKNVSEDGCLELIAKRPFKDANDFFKRGVSRKINKRKIEYLIFSGALDCFGDRGEILQQYRAMKKIEDAEPVDMKLKYVESMYYDFDQTRDFFERSRRVYQNFSFTKEKGLFKIHNIFNSRYFNIISVCSLKSFYEKVFVSKEVMRKAGITSFQKNDEILANIVYDTKGWFAEKIRKVDKMK